MTEDQQGSQSLLVGTGNSSLDNIAFYQKCGFRMDHVRRDYFAYAQPPIWEDGILLQDMLMFRFNVSYHGNGAINKKQMGMFTKV